MEFTVEIRKIRNGWILETSWDGESFHNTAKSLWSELYDQFEAWKKQQDIKDEGGTRK